MTPDRSSSTPSALDLPFEIGAERLAFLRNERAWASLAATARGADSCTPASVYRLRRVIGRRLVAIGSAIDPAIDAPPLART